MNPEISSRGEALLKEADSLLQGRGHDPAHGADFWLDENQIPTGQAWVSSAANLIQTVAPPSSHFQSESARIVSDEHFSKGVPWHTIQKMRGLLASLLAEAQHGLLHRFEFIIAAETFDQFLDHAQEYHRANKVQEAAVLVSAVLEDTLKRIARKNELAPSGKTLDPLVDEFVKKGVFTPVKAKRVKAYAGVRNSALHAEWDKIDSSDVKEAIAGVRELLDDYL